MNAPWFDPAQYAWIPGTLYGVTVGLFGSVSGVLAQRGAARRLCLGAWAFFLILAAALLTASVAAFLAGQPYGIWYGLGLPGVLGLILCPTLYLQTRRAYAQAEERRMHAADAPLR